MFNRRSPLVQMARCFQAIPSPIYDWVDPLLLRLNSRQTKAPQLFIIAPPRSGSTLTYQVLASGLDCLYLNNLWNLLYAIPYIGARLSRDRGHISSFTSHHGLVPGLKGEAEGLRFWTHWTGQGLSEASGPAPKKAEYLRRAILAAQNEHAFLSSYLGHVFCIDYLRELFPNPLFIYLKRDYLSNAYSLYKAHNQGENWFSLRPKGIDPEASRHKQVVQQLLGVHRCIQASLGRGDSIEIGYEALCENPREIIDQVSDFAAEKGYSLPQRSIAFPDFSAKTIHADMDADAEALDALLKASL